MLGTKGDTRIRRRGCLGGWRRNAFCKPKRIGTSLHQGNSQKAWFKSGRAKVTLLRVYACSDNRRKASIINALPPHGASALWRKVLPSFEPGLTKWQTNTVTHQRCEAWAQPQFEQVSFPGEGSLRKAAKKAGA